MEVCHKYEVDVGNEISRCGDQQDASSTMAIRILQLVQIFTKAVGIIARLTEPHQPVVRRLRIPEQVVMTKDKLVVNSEADRT